MACYMDNTYATLQIIEFADQVLQVNHPVTTSVSLVSIALRSFVFFVHLSMLFPSCAEQHEQIQ